MSSICREVFAHIIGSTEILDRRCSCCCTASAIPGAKLILYPRVGHLPQIEIPQRSAADVASFLPANPPAPVSSAHATGLSG